tara:strand:+ start:4215 stop:4538 length:324 start_codon:yes stop_codon:yes gene_type:complete
MKNSLSHLTLKDYKHVLKFYGIPLPKNKYTLKKKANSILAKKLCRCIKKVNKTKKKGRLRMKEKDAIAICRKSVINRKGFKSFGFTCKNPVSLINKKGEKYKLLKTV